MTQNASHETNLTKIVGLMDDMMRIERYGAFAAAATGSFAFSMAGMILDIEARNQQLADMDARDVPREDPRRERVSSWLKDLENRLDRLQEQYNWFRTIAINEGMEEFTTKDAKEVYRLMRNPQAPEMAELEHHAQIVGCSLAEAKAQLLERAKEDADTITKAEENVTPMLQHRLDGLKSAEAMERLAQKFGAEQAPMVESVVELNNFEARRIAELIERKADQYAERFKDTIMTTRGRTSRQRRRKEAAAASMKLAQDIVKRSGEFADELTSRIDIGDKREGEVSYDTDHGTTQSVA